MKLLAVVFLCFLVFSACSIPVDREQLLGTWDYVKIDNLNSYSEDSTTVAELKQAKPYISFSDRGELQIFWADKVLSSGTFHIEGKMIRYKENLPDGGTREFPFLVKSLSDTELVFETMAREGARVTAAKRR